MSNMEAVMWLRWREGDDCFDFCLVQLSPKLITIAEMYKRGKVIFLGRYSVLCKFHKFDVYVHLLDDCNVIYLIGLGNFFKKYKQMKRVELFLPKCKSKYIMLLCDKK